MKYSDVFLGVSLVVLFKQCNAALVEEEFEPSVKASCVGGTMTIRVDTIEPFEGVIHSPNRSESGCSVYGNGGLKTYLKIDLSRPEGSEGSCGVRYNTKTEERKVGVYVRKHQTVELLQDKLYLVTCGKAGFQNSRNEVSVVQLKITDGVSKVNAVLEGSSYHMEVQVMNHDPAFGILVKRCLAFDYLGSSIQLVDDRGCRAQKLISEFTYDDTKGTADAVIYSIFRMTNSNRTYFQCDVEICRGTCQRPLCELSREDVQTAVSQAPADPFQVSLAEDTVTTSTSVFVAEPGSAGAVGVGLCAIGDANPYWLTYLCIAFGILFGIMLLINIFLCSAMTCSCTKTEVIEKEPSIYDDYSVYDSQYGYASKAYNSESDYGSEYGMVEGADGRPQQPQQAPSEAGTYHSKYSRGGDNTLSRSRSQGGSRYLEQ